MNRLTDEKMALKSETDPKDAFLKLAKFETMYEDLNANLTKVSAQMEALKAENKTKTVTYNQLLAEKLTLKNLIGRFETYEL